MNSADLAFTPALEQARLIRSKEISPVELVQLYLERIERLDPQLGSFYTVIADRALDDARAKSDQLATATDLPPFFGVPIAIKDLTPVVDIPCSYGVKVLKSRMATEDAGVVTRLRKAGFIILGKTATSEIGSTPYTEPHGFPPTRNPWNLDYTPGGSSGGSAAAVAAGLCPVAHGSDGGGSIRGPASCCGLVGLKPSRGRISHAPLGDKLSGIATDGAIARTVADAAALLDVMSGYEVGDPYWLPDPIPSFWAATQRPPRPLRVGFTTTIPPIGDVDPICAAAVTDTVRQLESLGHQVEAIHLDFSELVEPFAVVWQAGVDVGVPWIFMGKFNRWLLSRSRFRPSGAYLRAVAQMQTFARRMVISLEHLDAIVLPIFMHPTIRVGEWTKLRPPRIFKNIINWIAPCPPINTTGQPAIAIPVGLMPNGLPIGVQIVGRPADEMTILALAAQLEAAQPARSRPALAGDDG